MKKLVILFSILLLASCKKESITPKDYIELTPVLIQVDAVHIDGSVIQSPITVAR